MVAAEALRELRRLVVADTRGHRPHRDHVGGEQCPSVVHPHLRELVAEASVADLGKRPLKLAARGGERASDPLELEVLRIVAGDQLHRLAEKLFPAFRRSFPHGHLGSGPFRSRTQYTRCLVLTEVGANWLTFWRIFFQTHRKRCVSTERSGLE